MSIQRRTEIHEGLTVHPQVHKRFSKPILNSLNTETPGLNNARIPDLDREEQLYVTLLVELNLPEVVQMPLKYSVGHSRGHSTLSTLT